jgi:hypothetical protein
MFGYIWDRWLSYWDITKVHFRNIIIEIYNFAILYVRHKKQKLEWL